MKAATVLPYRNSRFWSVYLGQELLAVMVYKKGAVKVAETVNALINANGKTNHGKEARHGLVEY